MQLPAICFLLEMNVNHNWVGMNHHGYIRSAIIQNSYSHAVGDEQAGANNAKFACLMK